MNAKRICVTLVLSVVAASFGAAVAWPPPGTPSLLKTIHAVGAEGKGNEAAQQAVELLSASKVEELPDIFVGFDNASPLAANYLRAVVETIVDRQLAAGKKLPADQLEQIVKDAERDPRARRLAYEVLLRVDKTAEERIIPGMLLDSSPEFRRDAVQRLIEQAEDKALPKEKAVALNRKALGGATDEDQVKKIAKSLKDLGETVNLIDHFGFLTSWKIVGPFNNQEFVGFNTTYPPEEKIDLAAKLEGQKGEVSWGDISTDHEFGIVDIAKSVAPHKGAVMYLTTEFTAQEDRDVEFRFGTPNAWKLWVNGKLLFGRDEYHRGMGIDQYSVPAKLKAGKNVVLLKLCQNEQEDSWAQRYQIQLRVCDSSGIAVKAVAANGEGKSGRKVAAAGGQK
ncbi:MAG: hypothetical protein H8E37_11895 [Planctomycetes bacterium]|nr:hypothetical protein [Planctomycetota bacterium]